mmetsp:Transcript_57190/g.150507  ORF Transcript_57190/g.150507 Transcript_57190/m.150507 type:complete len:245 (-) Transcript_57190:132-866(-)
MRSVRSVALALSACLALSLASEQDSVLAKGLEADDACRTDGDGPAGRCDVSLLQLRGKGRTALSAEHAATEEADARHNRTGVVMTLFHQTSPQAGRSILRTGFRRGSPESWCGSAIYFSPSAKGTNVKAVAGRGFMIEAVVNMGRIKRMGPYCDRKMSEQRLKSQGFRSMTLDRGGLVECAHLAHCVEYIIYNPRQVISMKGYAWRGTQHWWSPDSMGSSSTDSTEDDKPPDGLDVNATIDDCR